MIRAKSAPRKTHNNELPCGPFGSWRRGNAVGTVEARRVQGPEGATFASRDFTDNASIQKYVVAGLGYFARAQLGSSGDTSKSSNLVLNLTITQCSPMRGTMRTLSFWALRGAGIAAPMTAEIIASREAYQPIIRADGYFTSESETLATTTVSLSTTPAAFSITAQVPNEAMQVAVRFEFDWTGATLGGTAWVAVGAVGLGEGAGANLLPSDVTTGSRYYRATYPTGMPPGNNPMLAGARRGVARQVGLSSGGNPTYGTEFEFSADMIVVPTALCYSPATGANGVAWNGGTELDVTASLYNVCQSGVSALVSQGAANVSAFNLLSAHLVLEAMV